jgi:hypothetical protein
MKRRTASPIMARVTHSRLIEAQQRITIRHMLAQGGVVTPIGPNAIIRISSGGSGTFPARLVEEVQHDLLEHTREWAP